MKKKILSWIFAVLSCLLLLLIPLLFLIIGGIGWGETISIFSLIVYSVFFAVILTCGIVARKMASDKSPPYYIAVPFCIFYLIALLANGIYRLVKEINKNGVQNSGKNEESETVYLVYDGGYKRTLYLIEKYQSDYFAPKWIENGAKYDRFKDDIGRFWRSYDGRKTFMKEDSLREQGWYIN